MADKKVVEYYVLVQRLYDNGTQDYLAPHYYHTDSEMLSAVATFLDLEDPASLPVAEGDFLRGFCGGYFGRDAAIGNSPLKVITIGRDFCVVRRDTGDHLVASSRSDDMREVLREFRIEDEDPAIGDSDVYDT